MATRVSKQDRELISQYTNELSVGILYYRMTKAGPSFDSFFLFLVSFLAQFLHFSNKAEVLCITSENLGEKSVAS